MRSSSTPTTWPLFERRGVPSRTCECRVGSSPWFDMDELRVFRGVRNGRGAARFSLGGRSNGMIDDAEDPTANK